MKKYFNLGLFTTCLAMLLTDASVAFAAGPGFKGESWQKVYYFSGVAGKGSKSGLTAGNAKPIATTDIMDIEAGSVIERVYMIVDTAISGTTNLDVGDDDDADGFIDGSLSVTLGTPGMYGWDAKFAGAYLRIQTAGVTSASDIFVVPNAKYYSASGKEIKLAATTTNTGGAFRIVVEGFKAGTVN